MDTVSPDIERIETLARLAEIEPEWWALWEADAGAAPFQSPAWMLPWVAHLWGGGKMLVLALRSEGRLIGLAPFFLWGYGEEPEEVRVSFIGSGITDYLGTLAAREFERPCAEAVLRALWEMRGEWHVCDFQELAPGSPLLQARVPEGLVWRDVPCGVCPVAELAPTLEEHLAGLDHKFRTGLRRAENRLANHASVERVRADAGSLDRLLDALFRLHAARWEERADAGVLSAGQLQAFHREAARRMLEHGMLRLYGFLAGGECVAVQYNLAARGRAYAYLSGFDPSWSKWSPGLVLLKHSIAEAIAEGVREFDFLRKGETFKYLWGARDRVNRRLVLTRSAVHGGGAA